MQAADVRDFEALSSAIIRAHEWKAIDVMVCNAGLTRGGYLGDGKMEDIELTVNTNLMGTINALHTALPLLKAHSCTQPVSIVIMGSLSSLVLLAPLYMPFSNYKHAHNINIHAYIHIYIYIYISCVCTCISLYFGCVGLFLSGPTQWVTMMRNVGYLYTLISSVKHSFLG